VTREEERDAKFRDLLRGLCASHGLDTVSVWYSHGAKEILEPFTALRITPRRADEIWREVRKEFRELTVARAQAVAMRQNKELRALRDAAERVVTENNAIHALEEPSYEERMSKAVEQMALALKALDQILGGR
jgi:hypothetical protein